jgi:hypothetical protein
LVLGANPINTAQLRLDEEVKGIQTELERARYRDRFEFINEGAVRVEDLSCSLLKHSLRLSISYEAGIGHVVDVSLQVSQSVGLKPCLIMARLVDRKHI